MPNPWESLKEITEEQITGVTGILLLLSGLFTIGSAENQYKGWRTWLGTIFGLFLILCGFLVFHLAKEYKNLSRDYSNLSERLEKLEDDIQTKEDEKETETLKAMSDSDLLILKGQHKYGNQRIVDLIDEVLYDRKIEFDKSSAEAQVKAAMSACIATEIRNGKTPEEAKKICYNMMRAKIGKELGKPQPEP